MADAVTQKVAGLFAEDDVVIESPKTSKPPVNLQRRTVEPKLQFFAPRRNFNESDSVQMKNPPIHHSESVSKPRTSTAIQDRPGMAWSEIVRQLHTTQREQSSGVSKPDVNTVESGKSDRPSVAGTSGGTVSATFDESSRKRMKETISNIVVEELLRCTRHSHLGHEEFKHYARKYTHGIIHRIEKENHSEMTSKDRQKMRKYVARAYEHDRKRVSKVHKGHDITESYPMTSSPT